MTISVGEKVPAGSLMVAGSDGISDIPMAERLAGKSVVIFGFQNLLETTVFPVNI